MSLIYNHVELHNVAEVKACRQGIRLQRVPEDVRLELNESAQIHYLKPDNCEIRYVSDSAESYVTLSSEEETDVTVFYGSFDGRLRRRIGLEPVTIRLCPEDILQELDHHWWKEQPFSPQIRRLVFGGGSGRAPVILHEIKGENIRPPHPDELPKTRYLAYGTSITQGYASLGPHLNYAAQTAWHLKADLINLGVGSGCHCEPALADYIARRTDWNIASLALSVNMIRFSLDEFEKRIAYMVNTVAGADTSRPVACITLFPHSWDFGLSKSGGRKGLPPPEAYRQSLRDVVARCRLPNVHLIEGPELLTNIGGLTADLLHPSDNAMIEIGKNLANMFEILLKQERASS